MDDFALAISTLRKNARGVHREKIIAVNERLNSIKGDLSSEQQLLVDVAAELRKECLHGSRLDLLGSMGLY